MAPHPLTTLSATAHRTARVIRNTLTPSGSHWRAGTRLHLPLRPGGPDSGEHPGLPAAAQQIGKALLDRPDVLHAHWDTALSRLVLHVTEEADTEHLVEETELLAARHGLTTGPDPDPNPATATAPDRQEPAHPGDTSGVRAAALVLACDAAGIATAVTARAIRLRQSPRVVTAAVALLREDSRVRTFLQRGFGCSGADLVLAAAGAAAHGFGQSPTALVLDAALRTGQLAEAVARAVAFDAAHDSVCAPDRQGPALRPRRPELRRLPAGEYADKAVTGSLAGAAATLLFTRNVADAADAVLAGSPKAARYGPAAFTAALGIALARGGVLVRDIERLRRLELVDTVVLHPTALHGERRTVLEAHPSTDSWDRDRLWQAATAVLDAAGEPEVSLRPVPDHGHDDTGLMIASAHGQDIGTVLVGRELDPLAEAALDAARRAGLEVVLVDDPSLGDFASLADTVVPADTPLAEVVEALRADGRTVLTVARVSPAVTPTTPTSRTTPAPGTAVDNDGLLTGLLTGDLAVAVTDRDSAVVWSADVLALDGMAGVWRLLAAAPVARAVGRRAKVLARSGAALSGLLVITGGSRSRRTFLPVGLRVGPVNAAAAAALFAGVRAARGVAARSVPGPAPRVPWHALRPEETLSRLARVPRTAPGPLSVLRTRVVESAAARTVLAPARLTVRLVTAVRAELDDPLTPVLAVGAAASAVLGSVVDALLVSGALMMNALVGGVQRLRAERALAALAVGQRRTARRLADPRTGTTSVVDAARLAPGEVVELGTGDVVPADARLLEVYDLEVDESALTGESLPSRKQLAATPRAVVADRSCMVFEGTTVVAGRGRAVVVGTGEQTQAGRAAALASRVPPAAGVQARLQELTSSVLPLTLAGGAAVTGLSLLRGRPVREAVGGGVAVAVAAVPEGLPLVATVAQMAAARRLSRRGVLVRAPRTLEALGRVDTICFDKTGTLTENRLQVVRLVTADGHAYAAAAPEGEAVLRAAARACPRVPDAEEAHAHATDEAVLAAAAPDPQWIQTDAHPFEASRGYAAATGRLTQGARPDGPPAAAGHVRPGPSASDASPAPAPAGPTAPDTAAVPDPGALGAVTGQPTADLPAYGETAPTAQPAAEEALLVVKGAPEVVLPSCADVPAGAERAAQALAAQGLRVLAVARRRLVPGEGPDVLDKPLDDLALVGFVALADAPRPDAAPLVAGLRRAGVRPVVLTGDHPQTARAVAVRLGWPEDVTVVTGDRLAGLDRAGRAELLRDCGVVARVAPEQKLQVVEALQEAGRVVAMVGDGANDAAAIRAADVGVGIAARGSAAARNAADLVLTGDGLSALVDAVAEGRALWRSVADAVSILIGGNAGEVGFTVLGTLLGGGSPLSTRQLLLINLLTDMFPAMAVAVTPQDAAPGEEAGEASPGAAPVGLAALGAPLTRQIRQRGLITGVGAAVAWLIGHLTPGSARRSSTMALCGVVGAQLTQTVAGRQRSPLVLATTFGSALVLAAVVQTPVVSHFFGCTPLGPVAWTGVGAAVGVAALAPWLLPPVERQVARWAAHLWPTVRVIR
ncbi:HAD-IC family P-type ATPase [Streptomyces gamaensis]|uniref:HAD-IC family P-type ATPase n=1 Tax=Streptomyces gamaensis TaxID=1763542 RepID=A0ABW0YVP1_9ACTN